MKLSLASRPPPLAIEPGVGIRGAPMRVVGQALAVEVHLGVAPARRRLGRSGRRSVVLGPKALHGSPGLDGRAVHAEMVLRQKPLHPRDGQHGAQEGCCHAAVEQAVAVLGESRCVPDRIIDPETDEPAEQQVEVEAAPSAGVRNATSRRPATAWPAEAARAGSRGDRSPSRSRRSARRVRPAPRSPKSGSFAADDPNEPAAPDPHRRTEIRSGCPVRASEIPPPTTAE